MHGKDLWAVVMSKANEADSVDQFENFRRVLHRVVSVPRDTIRQRVEEHRADAAKNPNRRGPKPKRDKS